MAIYDQWRKNVTTSPRGDDAEEVLVGLAPREFFETLGIQPIQGRLFTAEEGLEGRNHVALITETFWKSHYQRDPKILGRMMSINDQPYAIIGVLPATIPGWLHFAQAQLPVFEPFLPDANAWSEQSRGGRGNGAIGLLKPGVTNARAQADLARIAENLAATHPVDREVGISVLPLATMRTGDLRPVLLLLMGAVGLILLIACSNLAALLLARNTARQREFAVRKALGAGPAALVRQILTETLVLSLLGSACGLALACGATRALRTTDPGNIPQLLAVTLDWRVALFTLAAGLGTCLFFGMAPALLSVRLDAAEAMKEGGRTSSGGSRQGFRKLLVIAQIALSMMLLVGAGLLIQTLERLENQDLGFRVDHLMRGHFYLPPAQYPAADTITPFCDRLTERIRALPGVRDVSVTTMYPPSDRWRMMFSIEGRPVSRLEDVPSTIFGVVDANYLSTAGIPVVAGRDFSESDREATLPVAVVNQAFVKQYFPNKDPIGQRIELGAPASLIVHDVWMGTERETVTIAGVMRDNRDQGLALPVAPQLIALFRQVPKVNFGFKDVLVRSRCCARSAGAGCRATAPFARSAASAVGGRDNERIPRQYDGSEAIHERDSGELCGSRAAAGGNGDLRSDCIPGGAAHAGDWDSARTRRAAVCRGMAGVIAGTAHGLGWRCDWTDGDGLSGSKYDESALWDLGARPRDDGFGFDCPNRDCSRCMCAASETSGKDRSDSSTANGITDRLKIRECAVG